MVSDDWFLNILLHLLILKMGKLPWEWHIYWQMWLIVVNNVLLKTAQQKKKQKPCRFTKHCGQKTNNVYLALSGLKIYPKDTLLVFLRCISRSGYALENPINTCIPTLNIPRYSQKYPGMLKHQIWCMCVFVVVGVCLFCFCRFPWQQEGGGGRQLSHANWITS